MLDFFTIFSKGGILLWCFKGAGLLQKDWDAFTPAVNTFIKTVLLQEKTGKREAFESGSLALKYKLDNEFELVFVVGYQKVLPLLYLDKLLDEIQLRFRDRFADDLKENNFFGQSTFDKFGHEFVKTLEIVETDSKLKAVAKKSEMRSYEQSSKSQKTIASMVVDNNATSAPKEQVKMAAPSQKSSSEELDEETRLANLSKLAKKKGPAPYKAKSPKADKVPKKGKDKTQWDPFMFGGKGATGEEARKLDRSAKSDANEDANGVDVDNQLNQFVPDLSVVGKSADIEALDEEDYINDGDNNTSNSGSKGASSGLWSSLSSLVGQKQLSMEDIDPVIAKMRDHLIGKNVAADVANKLCQSVAAKLDGKVMGTFSSVQRTVKDTLTDSLLQLLTPKRRVDIIRDVLDARVNRRPYVVTFCGVNGVGKSTNLAKICFWLVENRCRVLVAACDTFRAGAVEQLRTHVRRLNNLYPQGQADGKPVVELYEKGYGKDAAGIAMEAINYARTARIDVVLVDTAGRMQDNEPLMRSLTKLIAINAPDLVLFVGEALVGNEAVDQLVKFNAALADHSSQKDPHLIDGIVLTKFDTIDDKVGSAISMTYITGQPIVFVGTGQTYTDLKALNAKAVVQMLMK